jgi:Coenzyme F420-dependent N5,N10-methylene tetrahydromethanopterin reductase and related flavin-dependent oxidoreductases
MTRRFGMRLDGWMTPQRCVELAVAADGCGFDALWFAENTYGRGVIPAVAACMVATKKVEVGIGVFNPFNRHPSLIAMEMGALDELSNGRANLGIGTGVAKLLKHAHLGTDKPIAAMRDTINIVRGLMAGETVTYEGKVFSADRLKLEFDPIRKDYPIHMASMGDQSIRLAGELADAVMISNLCTPGFTRHAVEMMASVADKRVLPRKPKVIQYAPCVARADRQEARNFARTILGGMIMRSFGLEGTPQTKAWHALGSNLPMDYFDEVFRKLEAGEKAVDVIDDTLLDLYTVSGNADDCLAAYQRYLDAGVEEVVVTFRGPEPLKEMAYLADALKTMR